MTSTTGHITGRRGLRLVGQDQAGTAPAGPWETTELCARHADDLAGEIEAAERAVLAQIQQLGTGDLIGAQRAAFGIRATLRTVANSLGELHTALDEAAHSGRPEGAS